MCGICGIANFTNNSVVDHSIIYNMTAVMSHRGPDEDGFYFNKQVAFGMRRLKIIDMFTGSQPIYNEDGQIVTVFNGEIYNFKELAQQLTQSGHKFRTKTDTEVICHLYEQFGESFLEHINGMFALAIWEAFRSSPYSLRIFAISFSLHLLTISCAVTETLLSILISRGAFE